MSALVISDLYSRVTEKQPVFDFMIKAQDFYLNTHGVSVTEQGKSYTNYNDGFFYILNRNNIPIYFNGIYFNNARMRRENGYPPATLKVGLGESKNIDGIIYDNYEVKFRGNLIGHLTLSRKEILIDGSNFLLYPFQSAEFSMTYRVINLNRLDLQYYGKSDVNKNNKVGTIDFNFMIKSYTDKNFKNLIEEEITFSVNCVDTGYVPFSISNESNTGYFEI